MQIRIVACVVISLCFATLARCLPLNATSEDEVPEIVSPEIVAPIFLQDESPLNSANGDATETSLDELKGPRLIERNIIIENDNETHYYRGFVESAANITTIIRLTNLINNTNIINMPTTLNNTNINNIHIYQNKTSEEGGKFGLGYTEKGSCCYAVEPKNCKRSTTGLKCRHKKRKVCGRQCTSKIMHVMKNQPSQNPCAYPQQWPNPNCHQFQPPAFYPSGYPPMYPSPPMYQSPPMYYPPYPPQEVNEEDEGSDDFPLFPDDDELESPDSGWIASPDKCKIVSEDGLQIFNCTEKDFDFVHPFARYEVRETDSIKRNARHAKHPSQNQAYHQPMQDQMYPPQMAYYPVVYQPVYMPMPVYLPQYYPQPPPMNYYQQAQQLPLPPFDDHDTYDNEQESNEITFHQQQKKHSNKRQPIVMTIDEEL